MIDNKFAAIGIATDSTDASLAFQHGGVIVHRQAEVRAQAAMGSLDGNRGFIVGVIVSTTFLIQFWITGIRGFFVSELSIAGIGVAGFVQLGHTFFAKRCTLCSTECLPLCGSTRLAQGLPYKLFFLLPAKLIGRFFLLTERTGTWLCRENMPLCSEPVLGFGIAWLADVSMDFVMLILPDKIIKRLGDFAQAACSFWWFFKGCAWG